ncbi:MAG: peptidoglycan DD-metalloendopeptidase family protein [Lachnospiraceae bacterium]|nr:peptidoglycan DD-metalloendopeptidase family protein [Lachnospiraceae bacterium]
MGECFRVIVRMSLTASLVIAAVFLIRLLLMRAPRRYSYVLWLVVLIRLICPAAPSARFGVVPDMARMLGERQIAEEQIQDGQTQDAFPAAGSVWTPGGYTENGTQLANVQKVIVAPDVADLPIGDANQRNPLSGEAENAADMQEYSGSGQGLWWVSDAAFHTVVRCWLCGCLIFIGYGIMSYLRLGYRLRQKDLSVIDMEAETDGETRGVFKSLRRRRVRLLTDSEIGAPFTVGIFRPLICLPEGLFPFQREMVLAHENMHIRRQDNLLKLLAYAVRCVHWFNPFVWLAFRYFEEDMEVSCDEAVLRKLGYERRKEYAKTLLALSECGRDAGGFYPVSFGRKNAKGRIRNVLSVKKARTWVVLASASVVVVAAAVLMVNRKPAQEAQNSVDDRLISGAGEGMQDNLNEEDGQVKPGTQEAYAARVEELERQEELQAELQELNRQFEEEHERKLEEIEDQHVESGADQEAGLAAQVTYSAEVREFLDALGAEAETTEFLLSASTRVLNGSLPEGEICLEDSEGYGYYTDQAIQAIYVDSACALLCNPRVRFGESGVDVEYSFPFDGIEDGSIMMSAAYGCREHPISGEVSFHSGIDFAAEKGTPIYAVAKACVYRTGFDTENGNYVILIHANGELTYYAHCESVEVQAGDIVERGQQIATVGSTGNSTGAHLHFAVSRRGAFVLPILTNGYTSLSADSIIVIPVESRSELMEGQTE